jgi:hypothetical protein
MENRDPKKEIVEATAGHVAGVQVHRPIRYNRTAVREREQMHVRFAEPRRINRGNDDRLVVAEAPNCRFSYRLDPAWTLLREERERRHGFLSAARREPVQRRPDAHAEVVVRGTSSVVASGIYREHAGHVDGAVRPDCGRGHDRFADREVTIPVSAPVGVQRHDLAFAWP